MIHMIIIHTQYNRPGPRGRDGDAAADRGPDGERDWRLDRPEAHPSGLPPRRRAAGDLGLVWAGLY